MAFTKDGYLYFQDGNKPPVQLTHGGVTPTSPLISDDNRKIVFSRRKPFLSSADAETEPNLYSIDTDGSHERTLITPEWLAALGEGTGARGVRSAIFVPHTHQLLFNTYLCETQKDDSPCATGTFIVDADTTGIGNFSAPGPVSNLSYNTNGSPNFKVSPDGKKVSIVSSGHIDVFGTDGRIIRRNLATYTPIAPVEHFPEHYWLPDSSGLVIALPANSENDWSYYDFGLTTDYSVWRYMLNGDPGIRLSPDTLPPQDLDAACPVVEVSPDGNWMLYNHATPTLTGYDEGFYIENLKDGHTQLVKTGISCATYGSSSWSPDNKHFLHGGLGMGDYFIGAVSELSVPISGYFLGWIDANHYLYFDPKVVKGFIGEIDGQTILTFSFRDYSVGDNWVIKRKRQ